MPASENRRARREQERDNDTSAQQSTPPYVYSRLPRESSIRLLELLPSPDEHIQCTLHTVTLDANLVFDALSYSWGNPVTIREKRVASGEEGRKDTRSLLSLHSLPTATQPNVVNVDSGAMSFLSVHHSLPYMDREQGRERSKSILCDGKSLHVTETLFSALRQLQSIFEQKAAIEEQGMVYLETLPVPRSKLIWIDQICIDQENPDERSTQVALMDMIFAAAQYVFAWIGDLGDLGAAGFDVVLTRGRHCTPDKKPEDPKTSYQSLGRARRDLYSLTALLSRQWFRRAWVVQEAVFARRLYLWSGPLFMDWWILLAALQTLHDTDMIRMSKFMGSLIRREPTTQLSKRLARIQVDGGVEQLPVPAVTDEEILNNIKGAKSLMTGVVEIKKSLGLQCFDTIVADRTRHSDSELDSRFASLVMGLTIADPTQPYTEGTFLYDSKLDSYPQRFPGLSNTSFNHLSLPSKSPTVSDPNIAGATRINTSYYNHDLSPLSRSTPTPISLFSLITRFRDVGASDPRDKVFAFLYLATGTPNLVPNYRLSVQAVFITAARQLLRNHNLTVLSYVQDPADTKVPGLPSYVPDFSVPLGHTPFVAHDGSSPYSASGMATSQPNFEFMYEHEDTKEQIMVMVTLGYYIDTVTELAATKGCYFTRTGELAMKMPTHYKMPSPVYVQKSRIFMRLAHIPEPARVEALWRTLVADHCSNTYPAPVSTGFGFSDWVSTHLHHTFHLKDMLRDHFAVTPPSPNLLDLEATQQRKQDTYAALANDEPDGYLCYSCAQEFWHEKLKERGEALIKQLSDMGLTSTWSPVRYLPDGFRTRSLLQCARTVPPRAHIPTSNLASNANCPVLEPAETKRLAAFEQRMREVKTGRRMFRTKRDLLGMGPKSVQEGDEVWVVVGAKVPFVLRPVEGGKAPKRYRLVGEAFVLGYMDGEVLQEKKEVEAFGLM